VSASPKKLLNRLHLSNPQQGQPQPDGIRSIGPAGRSKPRQRLHWTFKLGIGVMVSVVGLWAYGIVYYYNLFVAMKSKVEGDWANVEVVMQERHHIVINLNRLVVDYAQHERELLTKVTEIRGAPSSPRPTGEAAEAVKPKPPTPEEVAAALKGVDQLGPKQLEALFSRIQMVAEQYPQLKLTENFQQFSTEIVETEHKTADLLMQYNKSVNLYMTERGQWPGNHYAAILGFEPKAFFMVDAEELKFREVTF
jgi:LemA protein